jgi:hypothetical protein
MKKIFKVFHFWDLALAVVFLLQALNIFNVISTDLVFSLIGEEPDIFKIFISFFFGFIIFFVIGFSLEVIFLSTSKRISINHLYMGVMKYFFAICATLFFGGLLSAFRVFPLEIGKEYFDFYLFWFFIINFIFKHGRIVEK